MAEQDLNGLQVLGVTKVFGETQALAGVSFELPVGTILGVLGPSGCGKSTLLNVIAGLETPDQGEIAWDGIDLKEVPPHQRGFGLMFQDFALFPHRNVAENVAFGLQMARMNPDNIRKRVQKALDLVGLPGFGRRDVNTLSGGEQQRVALARSLAPHPRLLMLDEPLGSLDRTLRERLVYDLHEILQSTHQTGIYVTHDQEEAFILADQVILMNAGKVEQSGSPQEIYCCPASPFVARFLGMNNLLDGEIIQEPSGMMLQTILGGWAIADGTPGKVTVLLRPDATHLDGRGPAKLEGIMQGVSFKGRYSRAAIEVAGTPLTFEFPSSIQLPRSGDPVEIHFDPKEAIQVFPALLA